MNVSKPPFSAASMSQSTWSTVRKTSSPSTVQKVAPSGRHGDDLVVLDDLDASSCRPGRRRGRREEHLLLADAHEQRALVPRADEQLRVLAVEDDEREVPFQLGVGGAHRRDEVALVVALDEVRDDLGVRLGRELVALLEQRRLQLAVVLDDPVEDEVDVALRGSPSADARSPRRRGRASPSACARRRWSPGTCCSPRRPSARWRLPTARISASFPFSTSARPAES